MPYIKQDQRQPIDELLKSVYEPGYFNYNRSVGLINCVAEEWYRRQIAPYEDKKIEENGDV